jgi:hypothetical protein
MRLFDETAAGELNQMKTKPTSMPVFKSESDEADWWASGEGRRFVKQKSAELASKRKNPKARLW